jgi:hypothetical protein
VIALNENRAATGRNIPGQSGMSAKAKRRHMTKKQTTNNLSERAMIVRLAIGRWYGTVTDQGASRELAQQKHADPSMVSLRKQVIPRKALLEINSTTTEARELHRTLTLPWSDGGYRILSADGYFPYMEKMRALRERFAEAVESFLPRYDEWYQKAKGLLGDLLRQEDYPKSGEELRRRFYFRVRISPLSQAADFRVKLNQKDANHIRAEIEADIRSDLATSMREPWERLYEKVAHLAERLRSDGTFRRANIDNLRELVEIIPMLNIVQDRNLDRISRECQKLFVDADDVRANDQVRNQTADQADAILGKIEKFI